MVEKMINMNESILVPLEDKQDLKVKLVNGTYQIEDYAEFQEMITRMRESVKTYEFQDEDRATLRQFGATFNKMKADLKSRVKLKKEEMFSLADEQVKELDQALTELRADVLKQRDEQDERDRQVRYKYLEERFEDMIFNSEHLNDETELSFDMLIDDKWLNRSTSENKAVDELYQKVYSVDAVRGSSDLPETLEITVIVKALNQNNWDGLRAISQIKDDIIAREEAEERRRIEEEIKKQREKELEEERKTNAITKERYETIQRLSNVSIEIKQMDLDKVKQLLEEHNIGYKVL